MSLELLEILSDTFLFLGEDGERCSSDFSFCFYPFLRFFTCFFYQLVHLPIFPKCIKPFLHHTLDIQPIQFLQTGVFSNAVLVPSMVKHRIPIQIQLFQLIQLQCNMCDIIQF